MHYLDLSLPTIEENLALDEALLEAVEEGLVVPSVRLWENPALAVVLGASGRIGQDVDVEACRRDGVDIARRSSGGGTVVVGPGALNFAVVLPRDASPDFEVVDRAQVAVLELVARSLRAARRPVEVRGSGDLTIGDRKISGSAQRRVRRHFLVHATILNDFDLSAVSRYTKLPERQPEYRRGRRHDDFLTNLGMPAEALKLAVLSAFGARGPLHAPDLDGRIQELVAAKFADPGWVNRL